MKCTKEGCDGEISIKHIEHSADGPVARCQKCKKLNSVLVAPNTEAWCVGIVDEKAEDEGDVEDIPTQPERRIRTQKL